MTHTEDFHRGFSVGIESWLHFDVLDADPVVKGSQDAYEVGKTKIIVNNEALHLMELRQMGAVQSLIPEDAIDREELSQSELIPLGQVVSKHFEIP
jgi:hypothetical protein